MNEKNAKISVYKLDSKERRGGGERETDIHNDERQSPTCAAMLPPPSGCENEHFPLSIILVLSLRGSFLTFAALMYVTCNLQTSQREMVFFYLGSWVAKLHPDVGTHQQ